MTRDEVLSVLDYSPESGEFRWIASRGRSPSGALAGADSHGYIAIRINSRRFLAHRLAHLCMTGEWPANDIDHINGLKSDNRWANLRNATRSQNLWNMKIRPNNTTGYKGVIFDKSRGKFSARLKQYGKMIVIGRFDTAQQAHDAYIAEAKVRFGEFARAA